MRGCITVCQAFVELKRKLPCFRGVDSNIVQSRSQEFDDLPDRLENLSLYKAHVQAAPLLCDKGQNPHHDVKYGATLSSIEN